MNRCTATPQCADRRSGWPARGCCRPTAGPCSAAPAPETRAGPAAGRTGNRPPAPSGARENRPTPALSGSLNSWSSILDHRGHVEQRRIDRRHRGTALLVITSYSEIIDPASGPLRVERQPTTRTLSISLDAISAQLPRSDLRVEPRRRTPRRRGWLTVLSGLRATARPAASLFHTHAPRTHFGEFPRQKRCVRSNSDGLRAVCGISRRSRHGPRRRFGMGMDLRPCQGGRTTRSLRQTPSCARACRRPVPCGPATPTAGRHTPHQSPP